MGERRETLRVAVVDDDTGFVRPLTNRLEALDWKHRVMSTPVRPHELVSMKLNALVIDPAVLGEDSWRYLESVCGALPDLAVIVCTRGSTVVERVRGLRLGADDWVVKPCHPEEVVARVEAVTRRRRRHMVSADHGPMVAGEIEVRPDQFQAFVAGVSLDLTRREFELLALLAENAGRVLERESVYERVWGYAMAHGDRSVDVFIRRLRNKLAKRSPGWTYVHTHFGVGYRFDPEPHSSGEPLSPPATAAEAPPRSQPFYISATAL